MTLAELEKSDKEFFTAAEIAAYIGSDPETVRWQAHECPEQLGFPVIVVKRRVKIPRRPFLKFIKGC